MCKGIVHEVSDITYTYIINDVSSMDILGQILPFENMFSIVQTSVFNVSYSCAKCVMICFTVLCSTQELV